MKLLTFLGTGRYERTCYVLNGCQHESCYCPAALVHFFQPQETLVVVTEKSCGVHYDDLCCEIKHLTQPIRLLIPDGHSEEELWAIFDTLTTRVDEGSILIVDITHGFRSLPFLSFLALAYLRVAKRVDVNAVYYGAYEARRQEANESPIFNLTPFVALLDWLTATDRFVETGDARQLAGLLRSDSSSGQVKSAARNIDNVAAGLFITSPCRVAEDSRLLDVRLREVGAELATKIPPFQLLAQRIHNTYASFGAEKLLQDSTRRAEDLRIQLRMIRWYMDNQHMPQALTLAREWLVSLTAYALGRQDVLGRTAREPVERALGALSRQQQHRQPIKVRQADLEDQVAALPGNGLLLRLWNKVSEKRNRINHAFHEKTPPDPHKFVKEAKELLPQLEEVARMLLGETP